MLEGSSLCTHTFRCTARRRSRAPLGRSRIARPGSRSSRTPCDATSSIRRAHGLLTPCGVVEDPCATRGLRLADVRPRHLAMARSSTGGSRSSRIFRCGKVVCSSRSPRASFDAKAGSSAARDLRAPYGARRSSAARDPQSHLAVRRGSSAARDPLSPCGNREVVCGLRLHSRSKICGRSLRTVVFATIRDRRQIFTLEAPSVSPSTSRCSTIAGEPRARAGSISCETVRSTRARSAFEGPRSRPLHLSMHDRSRSLAFLHLAMRSRGHPPSEIASTFAETFPRGWLTIRCTLRCSGSLRPLRRGHSRPLHVAIQRSSAASTRRSCLTMLSSLSIESIARNLVSRGRYAFADRPRPAVRRSRSRALSSETFRSQEERSRHVRLDVHGHPCSPPSVITASASLRNRCPPRGRRALFALAPFTSR